MRRRAGAHLLLTTRCLDAYLKNGLYWCREDHIANVQVGDRVFLYETSFHRLTGPFEVNRSLFSAPVGDEPDYYRCVFSFEPAGECFEAGPEALWSAYLERRMLLLGMAVTDRSACPLMAEDAHALTRNLRAGRPIRPACRAPASDVRPVELLSRADGHRFSAEYRLEAALVHHHSELLAALSRTGIDLGPEVDFYQQAPIPLTTYGIDLLLVAAKQAVVIEFKKDEVNERAQEQVCRYRRWLEQVGFKRVHCVLVGYRSSVEAGPEDRAILYRIDREARRLRLECDGAEIGSCPLVVASWRF